jgi:pyruvate/2-oxoacid:ferredoxin oxidoreductase alpha subunit
MKKLMMGTEAAAIAAKLARVQVIAAYPITPQTTIVEELANMVSAEELEARFLTVESEHSAMASCIGASATGARVFTATSSHGLAFMHEMLHYAAGGRYPIVMVNANRALGPPWNVYCDHTDSLAQRDTGWLQYYCADAQDVLDSILIGYRVAEQALLPVMINMDAFYLTHTTEIVDIPEQKDVDEFLPPYRPDCKLDVDNPVTFGNVCGSDLYMSIKFQRHRDTFLASSLWAKMAEDFHSRFQRAHPPVEMYRTNDAEIVITSIGTCAGVVRVAVDRLRDNGLPVGGLRLSLVRPFPELGIAGIAPRVRHVIVIDRDVSSGAEGIIAQEMKANLWGKGRDILVHGFIAGIGGRDITPDMVIEIVSQSTRGQGKAVSVGNSQWVEVLP